MFLKKMKLRGSAGVYEIDITEYVLRSRKMANGYWVTIAAVVIQDLKMFVLGASACSPDDEPVFSRSNAANRALGRARQQAASIILKARVHESLVGRSKAEISGTCAEVPTLQDIKNVANSPRHPAKDLYEFVSFSAEVVAVRKKVKALRRQHPRCSFSYVTM